MRKFAPIFLCLLFFSAAIAAADIVEDDGIPTELVESSVMVKTNGGSGSGVAFKNGIKTFVWTDAHVVADCQTIKFTANPNRSLMRVTVSYADVRLVSIQQQGGRKVGEDMRYGKIIRYSKKEDIALISVYAKNWLKNGVKFSSQAYVPKQGMALWHVGSPVGDIGMTSVMSGDFSFAGRIRKHFHIYDQVSLHATFGCSGGGVFLKKNLECIGLVTECLHAPHTTPGLCCMTPTRRLWDFAERNRCKWAMSDSVALPEDLEVLTEDDIEVPAAPAIEPEKK